MKKFKIFEKECSINIRVDKDYMLDVLGIINIYAYGKCRYSDVGPCGPEDGKVKDWYVNFITTDDVWDDIKKRLCKLDTKIDIMKCYGKSWKNVKFEVL